MLSFCGFTDTLVSAAAFKTLEVKGLWDVWGRNRAENFGTDFLPQMS